MPLDCHYSNAHPRETKRDKLERYVIEASKQCGRNVLMKIGELTPWANYGSRVNAGELRILAHPTASEVQTNLAESNIRIAVGPEGGFMEDEVALAERHGWIKMSLGPRILRVETAAIVLATRAIVTQS